MLHVQETAQQAQSGAISEEKSSDGRSMPPPQFKLGASGTAPNSNGSGTVQRTVAIAHNNAKNNTEMDNKAVADFNQLLDDMVTKARAYILSGPLLGGESSLGGLDGYTRCWTRHITKYAGSRSDKNREMLSANFGYAVESVACAFLQGRTGNKWRGHEIRLQDSKLGTRPDIVLHKGGRDVAWLDITASGSKGHIDSKQNWYSNASCDYAVEVTYRSVGKTDFDAMADRLDQAPTTDKEEIEAMMKDLQERKDKRAREIAHWTHGKKHLRQAMKKAWKRKAKLGDVDEVTKFYFNCIPVTNALIEYYNAPINTIDANAYFNERSNVGGINHNMKDSRAFLKANNEAFYIAMESLPGVLRLCGYSPKDVGMEDFNANQGLGESWLRENDLRHQRTTSSSGSSRRSRNNGSSRGGRRGTSSNGSTGNASSNNEVKGAYAASRASNHTDTIASAATVANASNTNVQSTASTQVAATTSPQTGHHNNTTSSNVLVPDNPTNPMLMFGAMPAVSQFDPNNPDGLPPVPSMYLSNNNNNNNNSIQIPTIPNAYIPPIHQPPTLNGLGQSPIQPPSTTNTINASQTNLINTSTQSNALLAGQSSQSVNRIHPSNRSQLDASSGFPPSVHTHVNVNGNNGNGRNNLINVNQINNDQINSQTNVNDNTVNNDNSGNNAQITSTPIPAVNRALSAVPPVNVPLPLIQNGFNSNVNPETGSGAYTGGHQPGNVPSVTHHRYTPLLPTAASSTTATQPPQSQPQLMNTVIFNDNSLFGIDDTPLPQMHPGIPAVIPNAQTIIPPQQLPMYAVANVNHNNNNDQYNGAYNQNDNIQSVQDMSYNNPYAMTMNIDNNNQMDMTQMDMTQMNNAFGQQQVPQYNYYAATQPMNQQYPIHPQPINPPQNQFNQYQVNMNQSNNGGFNNNMNPNNNGVNHNYNNNNINTYNNNSSMFHY